LARVLEPAEQHGMAPRQVRTDEHDEIGKIEILVTARNDVFAERPLVADDRRRHAKPRVRVDVGRADESLHQLVEDVVVLGQELPGYVESDRVRAVLCDRIAKPVCDELESFVPAGIAPVDSRTKKTSAMAERFGESCAFRTQQPAVGRMCGVAGDRRIAVSGGRDDPAADAAVRARRAHRSRLLAHRAPAFAWASPNSSASRIDATSRPSRIISQYHAPSLTSP